LNHEEHEEHEEHEGFRGDGRDAASIIAARAIAEDIANSALFFFVPLRALRGESLFLG
jgi:hypothetical protein